jgi:Calcineurin-like phosphoesterase
MSYDDDDDWHSTWQPKPTWAQRMAAALSKPRPEEQMVPLLLTDLHLDDNPDNEYRWLIIEQVLQAIIQHRVDVVFILGDTVDRKDHHSAAFVNRLIPELLKLAARAAVVILRGNHDTPLHGPAFWEFLGYIEGLSYVTQPMPWHLFDNDKPDLLLLPFAADPKEAWHGIRMSQYRALFMHATVSGAVVENGIVMENSKFPILPRSCRIYSGDVHVPQTVGNITYVGAPHPIKFGDKYPCRMLLLDEHFGIKLELPLHSLRKVMLDISSVEELRHLRLRHGDQVKIRFKCAADNVAKWGAVESTIAQWAADHGVIIAGTEILVDSLHDGRAADPEQPPEQILRDYAAHEAVPEELLAVGLTLLSEVR